MAGKDYTPDQRARNQFAIVLTTSVAAGLVLISGAVQSWPIGSFVAALVVIAAVAWAFWRLFASESARPLPTDRKHGRWPYLSKKKLEEIPGQWKDLGGH